MAARHLTMMAVVGILLLTPSALSAAEPRLEPGTRVRVRISAPHRQTLVGTVMAWERQSLQINVTKPDSLAGMPMDLSLDRVTRLEVSQGRKSKTEKGVLVGGALGLAMGFLAGAVVDDAIRSYPDYRNEGNDALVVLGGIGLAAGIGIGAIIGAMSKGESWHRLSPARLRVSVLPDVRSPVPVGGSARFEVTF